MSRDLIRYKAGDIIFRQGYPSDNAYVIVSGRVGIYREEGGRELPVAILHEGQMFGEMGVVDDQPRSASAKAISEVVLKIVII